MLLYCLEWDVVDDLCRHVVWCSWLSGDGFSEDSLDNFWGCALSFLSSTEFGDFLESLLPVLASTDGELLAAAALWKWDDFLLLVEDGLDSIGCDDGFDISVCHDGAWNREALLGLVDAIESLESGLCPDCKAANLSGWGELSESESLDGDCLDAWDVAESLDDALVFVVDNKWALLCLVGSTAELALGGAVDGAIEDALDITVNADLLEELNSIACALDLLDSIDNNDWDFLDFTEDVATSLNKWDNSCSGDGGSDGELALAGWDWAEPAAKECWWVEAVATTAEVSVSTLAISVGAGTIDTWNTSLSTACTPRDGRNLLTSHWVVGVWLLSILSEVNVDLLNDFSTDWCIEDLWEFDG